MPTPLEPITRKRVSDAIDGVIRHQVMPWIFMTAGPPFRIRRFDGSQISYEGIGFSGSPQQVFWTGYIEPFLENICVTEVDAVVRTAKERDVNVRAALEELQVMLVGGIAQVYREMASVDVQLARQDNLTAPARPVDGLIARMQTFLHERVDAERAMWVPPSPLEQWHARNKFWAWAISMAIAFAGVVVGLIALFLATDRRAGERPQPSAAPAVSDTSAKARDSGVRVAP